MKQLPTNSYAQFSLLSITLMALITSLHHIYRLGFEVLIPALIVTVLPFVLLQWFKRTGQPGALWTYTIFNVLLFVWFGFIDGFMDHVVKALGLPNTTFLPGSDAAVVKTVFSLWSPAASNFFYEGTGVLTFLVGVVAMYYGYKFIMAHRAAAPAKPLTA